MKVLMIEDNEETIHGLIDAVDERGWEHEVATFKDAQDKIITFDPDVIVMDWMFDDEDAELGKPILEDVLSKEFRPVIVFSAHDLSTVLEDTINEFPLINFTLQGTHPYCENSLTLSQIRLKQYSYYVANLTRLPQILSSHR